MYTAPLLYKTMAPSSSKKRPLGDTFADRLMTPNTAHHHTPFNLDLV